VLQFQEVSFSDPNGHAIYEKIDFGVDLDSRIALVGPNGAGKSTMLKLMTGDLDATDGVVKRHNHLKIGQYHQVWLMSLYLDYCFKYHQVRPIPHGEERAAVYCLPF